MSTIQVSEQYVGNYGAPLDYKLTPVANLQELYSKVQRRQRYIGMTVVVLNDGTGGGPAEYWLVGGTADSNWVKKTVSGAIMISGDDVD